jgi:aminoglycoside phosphotransferase (APT) family kinase protein
MADPHALPLDRLAGWLRANVADFAGTLSADKFPGGQSNPTYRLSVDGQPLWVLRKKPPGTLLPSAHAVDREFRVTSALAGGPVPVARPRALCVDDSLIGTIFYVTDYVAGRNFWDPRLPELDRDARAAVYAEMVQVLAALHSLDPDALGLSDFGRPGNYYARQVARWTRQYRATETEPIAAMEALIAWLPANLPAGDEVAIVHGDYRIDNLIFDSAAPRVLAVVDWELSTLGHPIADLAYHMMAWRLSPDAFRGLAGSDFAALGIPDEAAYRARYGTLTGRAIAPDEWEYAIAYNMFRVACIRQGVLHRALSGNASSDHAIAAGQKTRMMAETAWAQAQRAA